MNMLCLAPRSLAVALTGAIWMHAVAWPMDAGADVVPNRRDAGQPVKLDHDIVPTRSCADRITSSANCKPGFVWRLARPEDLVCVHPDWRNRAALDNAQAPDNVGPDGPDSCRTQADGETLVWREAFPGDHVCVSAEVRYMTRQQNREAESRRACN